MTYLLSLLNVDDDVNENSLGENEENEEEEGGDDGI